MALLSPMFNGWLIKSRTNKNEYRIYFKLKFPPTQNRKSPDRSLRDMVGALSDMRYAEPVARLDRRRTLVAET
jgi:hypothetical protein